MIQISVKRGKATSRSPDTPPSLPELTALRLEKYLTKPLKTEGPGMDDHDGWISILLFWHAQAVAMKERYRMDEYPLNEQISACSCSRIKRIF
jgi:hypothetical protein